MIVSHITFAVSDPQKAAEFYQSVFGLVPDSPQGLSYLSFKLGPLKLVLCSLEVLAREMGVGSSDVSQLRSLVSHNVENPAAVAQIFERAVAAGALGISCPQEKSWGGTSCFFADLDGNIWEVVWNPGRP
jgi:catechol 2,3-dioxygenase-like lactoylglutathione lyase family enzyme